MASKAQHAAATTHTKKRIVHVDSMHFRNDVQTHTDTDDASTMVLHLNETILNAHEVSLLSAQIPNEMYNVRFGKNTFYLWQYQVTGVPAVASWNATEITITPGLYTMSLLKDAVNAALPVVAAQEVTLTMAYDTSTSPIATSSRASAVFIPATHASTGLTNDGYAVLVHDGSKNPDYRNSILHRIGVPHSHVIVSNTPTNPDTTLLTVTIPAIASGSTVQTSIYKMASAATGSGTGKRIKFSGYETYDSLHLHLDIISGNVQRTRKRTPIEHQADTTRDNLLAVIPTNANIGSMITYTRPYGAHYTHSISGRQPISRVTLTLTDDNGLKFTASEIPDFKLSLEFTVVEQVPGIVQEVAAMNQQKAFQSRHMPIHLA